MKNQLWIIVIALAIASNASANQPTESVEEKSRTVIVPGDEIELDVYRESDLKQRVKVRNDGTVKLHLLEPLKVLGMTQREAEKAIGAAYAKDILVNPSVSISVHPAVIQAGKIVVHGRVGAPGVCLLPKNKASITILEAIGIAGGFTRLSNRSNVQVRREVDGKTTVYTVNVKKIQSDPKVENFKILPGDSIVVKEIFLFPG